MPEPQPLPAIAEYRHGLSPGNRAGRLLWKLVEAVLFRPSPAPLHAWRRFLLRRFGANVDPTAHVYPTARIWAPWNLTMEAYSCLSWGVDCYCVDRITLRRQAIVSQHARLVTASHDIRDPSFRLVHRPIEIGQSAWICAYAFVGMGVTVGEGAVVAATATAVKDVEPWAIVGGNPARKLGERRIGG